MRILIKGGVWKNTEDEILKAAVMKYGLNQWSRISSLLVRKSSKQCKARWYEWLDPSIKKTEWSREEEEKLLHLAKLMPTQWRTIAPLVGRTPAQCIDHYEKLLDKAQGKDEMDADDPRRLRPGEIDPNPETKPARPDPRDMAEDEKEMLSEARARLANTKGKKAKRAAREKQLEEARRLAALQKRREMRAAGIEIRKKKPKKGAIDYENEIVFQKKTPAGFYDTTEEDNRKGEVRKFEKSTLRQLHGGMMAHEREEAMRKVDDRENKKRKATEPPPAVMEAKRLNDPARTTKRSKLMLPPPQVSDAELEQIAKLGQGGDGAGSAGGSGATRGLVGSYATPMHTPMMRTPRQAQGGGDAIMQEAQNIIGLRGGNSVLLGGENPEIAGQQDFSGITPRKAVQATPNLALAAQATPGGRPVPTATPNPLGLAGSVTPGGSVRDELGINKAVADTSAFEGGNDPMGQRESVSAGLGALPAPKNKVSVHLPALPDAQVDDDGVELDAEDLAAVKAKAREARYAAAQALRPQAAQRGLPRPDAGSIAPGGTRTPDELLVAEIASVVRHDAELYPPGQKSRKARPAVTPFDEIDGGYLAAAKRMIEDEVMIVRSGAGVGDIKNGDFARVWEQALRDLHYNPKTSSYASSTELGKAGLLASLSSEYESILGQIKAESERAGKLEKKVTVLTGGYQKRAKALQTEVEQLQQSIEQQRTELACFEQLQERETMAAQSRINNLQREVDAQKARENKLQLRYADLR